MTLTDFQKQAYTAGAQQALVDFGVAKTAEEEAPQDYRAIALRAQKRQKALQNILLSTLGGGALVGGAGLIVPQLQFKGNPLTDDDPHWRDFSSFVHGTTGAIGGAGLGAGLSLLANYKDL
ncbi:hypothetical protein CMI47_20360 [Candidatus Pacearchaeota archaeon]|nr:hypothetical protein [Candidatus Pacearchaeota archaeon]|tara:strand:- start:51 stop:413 length:363 start_codon:yes stop_codon:yes gene_type:complete